MPPVMVFSRVTVQIKTTESKPLPNKESNMRANVLDTEYSSFAKDTYEWAHVFLQEMLSMGLSMRLTFVGKHQYGKQSIWLLLEGSIKT